MGALMVRMGSTSVTEPRMERGEIVYSPMPGERVVTVSVPEGTAIQTAFLMCVHTFGYWTEVGARALWIESPAKGLQTLLEDHYGILNGTRCPRDWGRLPEAPLALMADEEV